jgi:hypothetical protein
MRVRLAVFSVALGAALFTASPALPHHSNSAFHVDQIITLIGVVKDWQWVNPHTWLYLTVDDGKGGKVDWAIEGRAPGVLRRVGWDKAVLAPGETVTVHCSPAKDGSHTAMIARVTKADGTILGNGGGNQ